MSDNDDFKEVPRQLRGIDLAHKHAIQYYGISPHKINVLPFGANLEDRYILHGVHNVVKLLFVGVEWERKGAELAIQ